MIAKRHFVHVYATIRVKVAVDALNHQDAMVSADHILFDDGFAVRLVPHAAAVLDAEYAAEVTGYIVDEANDPDFLRTRNYDPDHQPESTPS
ncbi:hypothetical protein AWL63_18190 [Sphingomonas panacis]|uniref:Uncharacterized protein n=1 Tax=Sphingomonas panacis TaxID=1560345 RepID=A0A1B3ZDT2_9SPHN|nr:hypothetical protein [Sphingomonas panacis]AOH85577.1 hypothetical protein AWL63_18190 [Sphingomonas panacis]